MFKVLAIDGGGVRGIIPATVLAQWEDTYNRRCFEYFDLVVGTSTGSILAVGLALGIPASELRDLYASRSKKIFRFQSNWLGRQYNFVRRISVPPHNPRHLRDALVEKFGALTLDACLTRVCVPSVDVLQGTPRVFKTRHLPDYVTDYKLSAVDVVMASCAAPTFLPSCSVGECRYVDGGLWANNPSIVGIAEANKISRVTESQDLALLSLGCGSSLWHRPSRYGQFRGALGWSMSAIMLSLGSQSAGSHFIAKYLLHPANYKRVDLKLTANLSSLDNSANLLSLRAKAEALAREEVVEIHSLFGDSVVKPYTRWIDHKPVQNVPGEQEN